MTKNGFEARIRPYLNSMMKHCTELMALGFKNGDANLTNIAQDMNTCLQAIGTGFDTFFDENDLDFRVQVLSTLLEQVERRVSNLEEKVSNESYK